MNYWKYLGRLLALLLAAIYLLAWLDGRLTSNTTAPHSQKTPTTGL
jgi:hypothetical protein